MRSSEQRGANPGERKASEPESRVASRESDSGRHDEDHVSGNESMTE